MAKTVKSRTISKSATKENNKKNFDLIVDLVKSLKLEHTVKANSVTIQGNLSAYFDSAVNKYCLLSLKTGEDVFSTKAVGGLGTYLEKNLINKTPDNVADKKEETKTEKKSEQARKVKTETEDKTGRVGNRAEVKEVESVKVVKKDLLEAATHPVELVEIQDHRSKAIKGYQGVFDKTNKEVVSVVSETYNLLPNKSVIDPVLTFLEKQKIKYSFDRFSYVTPQRMRLHFTFPELKIKDDSKEGILASIFLHNSYNSTEAYKMLAGGVRQVCSNGLIIGTIMSKLRVIHQASEIEAVALANLESVFNGFYNNTKLVEARIKEMIQEKATVKTLIDISKKVETRIFSDVMRQLGLMTEDDANGQARAIVADLNPKQVLTQNIYNVYNMFTQYISHQTLQRYRLEYLQVVSKHFGL